MGSHPTGSLRPAPNWMEYLAKIQSIVDTQTRLLQDLRTVSPADDASSTQLQSIIARMDGFVSGLQMSLALSPSQVPNRPTATTTSVLPTSLTSQPPPRTAKPSAQLNSRPTSSKPSYKQTLLTQKTRAISALQAQHPVSYDPSRQLIYEPENEALRTQPISDMKFLRAVEFCVSDDFQISEPVELVRRLPRGGFSIQFSPTAFPLVQSSDQTLEPRTFGVWKRWHSPNPISGRSLVLNPVPLDIMDTEIIEELAHANYSIHEMTPDQVKLQIRSVQRLQFRHPESKQLQASRSIRVFCEDQLYEKILNRAGVYLGHRAVHARPYTPPKYRCYKCNALGSHKAEFCRSQRFQPAPTAPAVAPPSQAPPPDISTRACPQPTVMDLDSQSSTGSQATDSTNRNPKPPGFIMTKLPERWRLLQASIPATETDNISLEFADLLKSGRSELQAKYAILSRHEGQWAPYPP